jgi:hypothetical protein
VCVAEAGFYLVENGDPVLVPWEAIRDIEVGRRGLRIWAGEGRSFTIDLYYAGDARPLHDIISAHRPAAVRLRV